MSQNSCFTGSFGRLSLAPLNNNAAFRLLKSSVLGGADEGGEDALYQNKQPRVITKTQNQRQSPTSSQYEHLRSHDL